MPQVDVTDDASRDLDRIADFLSDFSVRRATEFIELFERVLNDLREFPDLGVRRGDRRVLVRRRYLFAYRRRGDTVVLLRVLDGRQQQR